MAIWLNGFNHLRFGFGFSLDPDKIGVDKGSKRWLNNHASEFFPVYASNFSRI
ncbi:MAG: hypothetical protein UU42_C0007G0013 [Candidatus Woesebacteria bacterium GW2011_GWA1_41_13b]|uniref:Uncharacterized protein n=1 Tax=Candidatus Woesebacteria bacterium GW2011_GWA1_41_13b TaxID=1618555 RepID=A0A0G0UWA9_9BACT|nr:MAG: hypothetical protein UU42_C0007G0013 [Candidatus Woesebacteria bacterium GW2011_GWA1_41_13b]